MQHNFVSGRLRHTITLYQPTGEQDDYGDDLEPELVVKLKADVEVKSGGQNARYGTAVTSEVITALCYYSAKVNVNQLLEWYGVDGRYQVSHIQPSSDRRTMIITAMIER